MRGNRVQTCDIAPTMPSARAARVVELKVVLSGQLSNLAPPAGADAER
jgi:hypothetical protein